MRDLPETEWINQARDAKRLPAFRIASANCAGGAAFRAGATIDDCAFDADKETALFAAWRTGFEWAARDSRRAPPPAPPGKALHAHFALKED